MNEVSGPVTSGGSPARRYAVLAVSVVAVVLVSASIASVNVALPDIGAQLRASQTDLQWIADAYTVLVAALLLPAGAIGDRYGRKMALLVGLVVFGLASLVAALAGDAATLIAARGVMGIGAALLFPSSLSLITTSFPANERGRAVGVWAAAAAAGAVIGLIAAGALLQSYWWGSLFLLNVVGCVVCLVAAVPLVPNGQREPGTRLDPVGALLAVVAIGATVTGIIEGPTHGWADPLSLGAVALGVVAGVLFLVYEAWSSAPLLDPRIFRNRPVSAGSFLITIQYVGGFGFFFVFTQYLQFVRGYSPFRSGLAGAPLGLLIMAGTAAAPVLGRRVGLRIVAGVSLLVVAAGCVVAASCGTRSAYWPGPALAFALVGLGLGLSTALGTTAITEGLPSAKQGVAAALNDTTREMGAALGIAVMGSLLNSGYRSSFASSSVDHALSPRVADAARSGFGSAQVLSHRLADPRILAAARAALLHGVVVSMVSVAVVLVVSSVVVAVIAPRRTRSGASPDDVSEDRSDQQVAIRS